MISDELLKELKQILLEDYQIQLTDEDLPLFANNLKSLFALLIEAVRKKSEKFNLIITQNENDKQSKTPELSA